MRVRSSLDILRDEYPGDEAWTDFAACYRPADDEPTLDLKDASLAATLVGRMGYEQAAVWLDSPVPALDGMTPRAVIASFADGNQILRHVVMRMP